jgi:DNA polymerase I-like protein with 3'-5' exonuclease and polymerase domains
MGLNALEGEIRLVQHSVSGSGEVLIWDFGGRDDRLSPDTLRAWSETRQEIAPYVKFVHHNTKFDLSWLTIHCKVDPLRSIVYDTMIASNIFWSGVTSFSHSLADLAKRLKVECHDKQLQKSDWGVSRLLPAQYAYAAGDVLVTDRCYQELTTLINRTPINNSDQIDLTMKLAPIVVGLNTHGYPTDTELLARCIEKAELDLEGLNVLFEDLMDCEASKTAEVISQFRAIYGIELADTTQATLQELQHPAARALMDIRALKMRMDYMQAMAGSVSPRAPHRTFTQYNITNPQASGRVSANAVYSKSAKGVDQFFGFNGLNPPKDGPKGSLIPSIRKIFAAQPNYKVVSTDLSGAHLRIALYLSGQHDVLDQMVNSPDGHAHTSVAIAKQLGGKYEVFNTLEKYFDARERKEPLVNELRELAKTGIYSVINICSAQSLQKSFAEKEIFLTVEECKLVLAGLWDRLPLVKKFVYAKAKEAAQTIALTTSGCRRPSLNYKDYRTLYTEAQEEAYNDALWRYGSKSTKTKALADKPIGFARVVSHSGRMRYFPIYERVNTWGVVPRIDRSVSAPAVASHLWASVESTVMAGAVVAFTNTFTNQGHPNCRIWAIPYDETCIHVPENEALAAATHLSLCMREAWDRLLPGVPGVTADPADMIGDSWADVH